MPLQAKATPGATSNALISTGPKALSSSGPKGIASKRSSTKRNENGEKPTTARALVLRNGKHGARGTGELVVVTKLLGCEKLDLLAEDLVEKQSASVVLSPFRIETCMQVADSQCSAFLDDIANLHDPALFVAIIESEWDNRVHTKDPKKQQPLKSATAMAEVVASRIHNAYMLASAWRIIADTLHDLEDDGLTDANIKSLLRDNETLRAKYLFLYHFVCDLVQMMQEKFALMASTTPHYAKYFRPKTDGVIQFDWDALKAAGKSFLDSIIVEIAFPKAPYPMTVLYQILRDAVDESPKEAKRFPQGLWDAVGDLSVCVELQAMLDAALIVPEEFSVWRNKPELAAKPRIFQEWLDATALSEEAFDPSQLANWKEIIYPLVKAKKQTVLESMWLAINQVHKQVAGKDIDSIWQVQDALARAPQWHASAKAIVKFNAAATQDDDDEDDGPLGAAVTRKKKAKILRITDGQDSDDSMPALQTVSNSSDEDDDAVVVSDHDDDADDGSDATESEYDEDQEDEIRDLLREAMDAAHEADLFGNDGDTDPFNKDEDDIGKGNAFLKLLGSLKGRVFSTSPKLKPKSGTPAPRGAKSGFFGKKTKTKAPVYQKEDPAKPQAPPSKKATVEEVEDEDDAPASSPKKKKKKKPKKKKKKAAVATAEVVDADADSEEEVASPVMSSPTSRVPPTSPASPKKASAPKSPVANLAAAAQMSSVSLAMPTETVTAQSARAYLKTENLLDQKNKVKSRSEAVPEKQEKGFLSKFGFARSGDKPEPKKRSNWFSRLTKRTTMSMHQLLRTSEDETRGMASMKWDAFVKLMQEMGFTYDPSTAGSSVRFDPPDPKDVSITFHKPHPDTTIHPVMLRTFAKRLKRSYGWSEADFLQS